MFDARHALIPLLRDIALAYAGGLVTGAPVALLAVWLTGIDRLATVCLLFAMTVVFVALRRSPGPGRATDGVAAHAERHGDARMHETRRVA